MDPQRVGIRIFTAAAGRDPGGAMLQESHRLAFNDELTGLPGRRALQEAMAGLGPRYALAMADVDHFKSFNDTHGHDIGDQVLKLVAARLADVEGGGPRLPLRRRGVHRAVPRLAARGRAAAPGSDARLGRGLPDGGARRGPAEGEGRGRKAAWPGGDESQPPDRLLSVTVSIGAAEPAEGMTPVQVLKAADEALYRAKRGGRNRVSK
jgi:GGDEF domain-containing protein